MTEVNRRQVGASWTSHSLGGRDPLVRILTAEEIGAITAAATAYAGTLPEAADFSDPVIARLMDAVAEQIDTGAGAVVLTGLDVTALGEDRFRIAATGLMSRLGDLAPQSPRGDRIGFVQRESGNPEARGYQSDMELMPHTDFHEIVALASVRRSPEGGESGLVSLAAVREIVAAERPELLPWLEQGFPHDTTGDGLLSDGPVPILVERDGVVSGYFQTLFHRTAAATLGTPIPPEVTEAAEAMRDIAMREDVIVRFVLQPGEIMVWHNFRVLHSREGFRDDPERRRLLLRFWVNPPQHLPVPPVYLSQRERFDRMHAAGEPAIVYTKTGITV